jgi:hypothetical protein
MDAENSSEYEQVISAISEVEQELAVLADLLTRQ